MVDFAGIAGNPRKLAPTIRPSVSLLPGLRFVGLVGFQMEMVRHTFVVLKGEMPLVQLRR